MLFEEPASIWIGNATESASEKVWPVTVICWTSTASIPSFKSETLALLRSPMVTAPKSTVPGETLREFPRLPPVTEKPQPDISAVMLIERRKRTRT